MDSENTQKMGSGLLGGLLWILRTIKNILFSIYCLLNKLCESSMKDGVKISEAGGTLGFPIKRSIIKALNLKWKDPVEFDIIDEEGNVIIPLQAKLKKIK